jgi:acetyltransferase-like isoleucine patch superfamily enzyme/dTDP-4-dehydrorhamnose 3,5-epimerase-like enzyme
MSSDSGFFAHQNAIVESSKIGDGTRIWAFAHVLPDAVIGSGCNICDHVFVENDVLIGDRVTIKCGVQVWDGVTLEDDVFIGPNVTFTNDPFPRSRQKPPEFTRTVVRAGASIGANATILPGLVIGRGAMVGAGSVVTRDVPPNAIAFGNPATITGYVDLERSESRVVDPGPGGEGQALGAAGARTIALPIHGDLRGSLVAAELEDLLPFRVRRFFVVFDVPSREVRGEHAHLRLEQFLICVNGQCSVVVDDGLDRHEVTLDTPGIGLYVPPMVWATQYRFSTDATLLVLASEPYDPDEYIRDYDEYLTLVSSPSS